MKVYYGLEEFENVEFPVVTTGTYDGVHLGHRKILARLRDIANREKGQTVLLTFDPHPRTVLYPDDDGMKLLNSPEEKIELLAEAGVDHLIIHPFTKAFSRLSSVEFVRDVLVNTIGTKKLVIGYNHRFGRNREGTFEHLKEYCDLYGFEVEEIPAKDLDRVNISSTKIRNALADGDIKVANTYLGYDYFFSGTVIKGSMLGRSIGFPTANIQITEKLKAIPADGVYAVEISLANNRLNGMLNIGYRPTLNHSDKKTIEVHIFDFHNEIYRQELKIIFKEKIRDEKRFENMQQLKKQLEIDRNKSMNILD